MIRTAPHARRKFFEAVPAEIGLLYCNKFFYLERTLKELEAEERKNKVRRYRTADAME